MNTFNDEVRETLNKLDGTVASAVMLMTGYSKEELDDLGGTAESAVEELFPEDVLRNLKDKRYRAMWELDKLAGTE